MENYTIHKVIGDGSFGTVYKGSNIKTGEVVAIKKMKTKYATWDECMSLRELKSLRKLTHPNIIKLKEAIKVKDELHFVFEFLDQNLYQLYNTMLQKGKSFTENQIRSIMYQTTLGLAHMHKHGFFHRDLKPENLLYHQECVKIADLGLAREIRSRPPYTDYVATRWYRAPEILLKSTNYNSPVDIFALGCILAELYTLSPLFKGSSEMDQLYKICSILGTPTQSTWNEGLRLAAKVGINFPQCSPVSLSSIIPNACDDAIQLINEMLKLDPHKRPSAQQVLQHPYFASYVHIERPYTPRMIEGSPTLNNKAKTGARDDSPGRLVSRASEYSNKNNQKDSIVENNGRNNMNRNTYLDKDSKGFNNNTLKSDWNETGKSNNNKLGGLTTSSILDDLIAPGGNFGNTNNYNSNYNNININPNTNNINTKELDTPTRLLEEEINQALESFKVDYSMKESVKAEPSYKTKDTYVGTTGIFSNSSANNFGLDASNSINKTGLYLPTKGPGFNLRDNNNNNNQNNESISQRYETNFDKPIVLGGGTKNMAPMGPSLYDFGKKVNTNPNVSPDLYLPKMQPLKYNNPAANDISYSGLNSNFSQSNNTNSNANLYNFSGNQGYQGHSMGSSMVSKPNLAGKNPSIANAGTRANLSLGGYNGSKIDDINNLLGGNMDMGFGYQEEVGGLGKYKY